MEQKGNSAYVYGRFYHDDELSHCLGIWFLANQWVQELVQLQCF